LIATEKDLFGLLLKQEQEANNQKIKKQKQKEINRRKTVR
jgi:hypothetical protein